MFAFPCLSDFTSEPPSAIPASKVSSIKYEKRAFLFCDNLSDRCR